jgi:Na+/H+ antiporter NhaD/arsenite permease-like protein
LRKYRNWLELPDSVPIGFTGVASEIPAPVVSNEVDTDSLIFGFSINITTTQANDALIRIKSISPQYNWMANVQATQQDTPIGAICGLSSQVMPVLPLVMPFFLQANGKLEMRFTNSAASPITGGIITLRRLKLVLPIDGGFNPGF